MGPLSHGGFASCEGLHEGALLSPAAGPMGAGAGVEPSCSRATFCHQICSGRQVPIQVPASTGSSVTPQPTTGHSHPLRGARVSSSSWVSRWGSPETESQARGTEGSHSGLRSFVTETTRSLALGRLSHQWPQGSERTGTKGRNSGSRKAV